MNSIIRRRPLIVSLTGAALITAVLTGCSNTTDTDPTVKPVPSASGTATTPAPTDAATSTPTATATAAGEPVPSTTGAAAPQGGTTTKPAPGTGYRLADPATWTIAGNEVGPVAIGGRTAAETDDLAAAYQRGTGECPAAPATQFWANGENPAVIVTTNAGNVSGVAVGNYEHDAVLTRSPKTAAGAGIGTSLTELQRLYPKLTYLGTYLEDRAGYSMWGIDDHGGHITFQLGEDGEHVGMVWVSAHPKPPYEFCG